MNAANTAKQRSLKKKLLAPFVTPEQFDFWSRELGSTAAWQRTFARVVERKQETPSTVSLVLKPNKNFGGFSCGQHVNVSAIINSVRVTRSYSITNYPDQSGLVALTIRQEPNGLMSQWLNQEAKVGSILELGATFGELQLPASPAKHVLLLAAGSGITPMMSLLRQAVIEQSASAITLLYWDKTTADFCFNEELTRLAEQHSHVSVHRISTREALPSSALQGRLNRKLIKQLNLPLAGCDSYACGGNAFIETVKNELGHQVKALNTESFSAPAIAPVSTKAKQVQITLNRSDRVITVSNQEPLLPQLEAQGVAVESGCRMGLCNSCTCQKTAGSTEDLSSNQINSESGSAIRLCVSRATGNIELAL